jgi:hypothetical protein
VIGTACGWELVQSFIDRGTVDGLDTSCTRDAHRPPFVLAPSGPDPAFTHTDTRSADPSGSATPAR